MFKNYIKLSGWNKSYPGVTLVLVFPSSHIYFSDGSLYIVQGGQYRAVWSGNIGLHHQIIVRYYRAKVGIKSRNV